MTYPIFYNLLPFFIKKVLISNNKSELLLIDIDFKITYNGIRGVVIWQKSKL